MQSPTARSRRCVVIVTNPLSGRGDRRGLVEQLVQCLLARRFTAEVCDDLDSATRLIRQRMDEQSLRVVVAAGGDGTLAELTNRTEASVPLTVFPLGTENLLAGHFGLEAQPERLCDVISAGATVSIDVGRANGRIFLLMASVGFDADVTQRMSVRRDGHIRRWSYMGPIWESLRHYDFPELRVRYQMPDAATGTPLSVELTCRWLFLFNLPRYARGIPIAPRAQEFDALLDLCAFRRGSIVSGLWYLGWILLRQHRRLPDFHWARVRQAEIESDQRVPYQLDGDHRGWLPLRIEVLPSRLLLMVPSRWAAEHADRGASSLQPELGGVVPAP